MAERKELICHKEGFLDHLERSSRRSHVTAAMDVQRRAKTKKGGRKTKKGGIYWEKQGSFTDTCRLHTLNAFYGRATLSKGGLEKYAMEFDVKYGTSGSATFTHIVQLKENPENVTCLLAFVVETRNPGRYRTQTCVPGVECEFSPEQDEFELVARFVWDIEHVWLEKSVENRWWLIDSRSDGPKQIKGPQRDCNRGSVWVWRVPKITGNLKLDERNPKPKQKQQQSNCAGSRKHQGDPAPLE